MLGGIAIARINENYVKPINDIYGAINERVKNYLSANPNAILINLCMSDAILPIPGVCANAAERASVEMGRKTIHEYYSNRGCEFLIEAIIRNDYTRHSIGITPDEVFVGSGVKDDIYNVINLFSDKNKIALPGIVCSDFAKICHLRGFVGESEDKKGSPRNNSPRNNSRDAARDGVRYLRCIQRNGFMPDVPVSAMDIIYLCYPNNPTGEVITRSRLKRFVDYAKRNDAVILYEATYRDFITEHDEDVVYSIYEIEGAKEVAIEFYDFSEVMNFTGINCSYCIIPKHLTARGGYSINEAYQNHANRKTTSYVTQRAAEAVYYAEGRAQKAVSVDYYLINAKIIREGLESSEMGYEVCGGINAPYVWFKAPYNLSSWDFFNKLLYEAHVIAMPGIAYGRDGEGYMSFTAFSDRKATVEAVRRIKNLKL